RLVIELVQLHDGGRRRHARRKGQPVGPAFERGDALFEGGAGRVSGARILVAAMFADRLLGEGRRLVDRDHHRASRRVGLLAGVKGAGGKPRHALAAHRDGRVWAMNSSRSSRVMMPTGRSWSMTIKAVAPPSKALKAYSTRAPGVIAGTAPSMPAPTAAP